MLYRLIIHIYFKTSHKPFGRSFGHLPIATTGDFGAFSSFISLLSKRRFSSWTFRCFDVSPFHGFTSVQTCKILQDVHLSWTIHTEVWGYVNQNVDNSSQTKTAEDSWNVHQIAWCIQYRYIYIYILVLVCVIATGIGYRALFINGREHETESNHVFSGRILCCFHISRMQNLPRPPPRRGDSVVEAMGWFHSCQIKSFSASESNSNLMASWAQELMILAVTSFKPIIQVDVGTNMLRMWRPPKKLPSGEVKIYFRSLSKAQKHYNVTLLVWPSQGNFRILLICLISTVTKYWWYNFV